MMTKLDGGVPAPEEERAGGVRSSVCVEGYSLSLESCFETVTTVLLRVVIILNLLPFHVNNTKITNVETVNIITCHCRNNDIIIISAGLKPPGNRLH